MIEAGCNSGKPDFESNDDDRDEYDVTTMTLDLMSPTELLNCIKCVSSADSENRGV